MRQNIRVVTVEELVDRESIRHVLSLYCRGMDRQDKELLAATYWPDSWDDHGLFEGSGSDFAESMPRSWPQMKMEHMLGQSCIEIHGDIANVETYFIAYHRMGQDPDTKDVWLGGRYLDRLQKRGDTWKILERLPVFDWWRDLGPSAPWDGDWWNGNKMAERNYGATVNDYSWELFSNRPFEKNLEDGRSDTPHLQGASI